MDGLLRPPAVTAFDAAGSIAALLITLGVAVAASARAPRDIRTRTFLVAALASIVPYLLTPLQWWKGSASAYAPALIAAAAASFCVGSVALFHFSQVFPDRRPWIRAHWRWLVAAYALLAPPVGAVAWFLSELVQGVQTALEAEAAGVAQTGSGGIGAVSVGVSEASVLLIIPALFVAGIVLPFAGLLSLVKSCQEARRAGNEPARITTFWILMSQMAGGVLTILVLPLLHLIGITGIWSAIVAALTYGFALLMPLAFAAAVWKYRLLEGISTSA